jgi:hypothetical protein
MTCTRRPIHEIERNFLHNMYGRNGELWDVVLNNVRREQQLPENVRELYEDAARRNTVRRRVREFIVREQRGYVQYAFAWFLCIHMTLC